MIARQYCFYCSTPNKKHLCLQPIAGKGRLHLQPNLHELGNAATEYLPQKITTQHPRAGARQHKAFYVYGLGSSICRSSLQACESCWVLFWRLVWAASRRPGARRDLMNKELDQGNQPRPHASADDSMQPQSRSWKFLRLSSHMLLDLECSIGYSSRLLNSLIGQ